MGLQDLLQSFGKIAQVKADADETIGEFNPQWLLSAIGAQLKKAALEGLAANPKLEQLQARLGTTPEDTKILWAMFLQHLKEDF